MCRRGNDVKCKSRFRSGISVVDFTICADFLHLTGGTAVVVMVMMMVCDASRRSDITFPGCLFNTKYCKTEDDDDDDDDSALTGHRPPKSR